MGKFFSGTIRHKRFNILDNTLVMLFSLLTLYGSLALALMMAFYLLEARNPIYIMLFALTCFASAIYGFLSGVYPFFVIELIWGSLSFRRYYRRVACARNHG